MKIEDIISHVIANRDSAFFYTPPQFKSGRSFLFSGPGKIISVKNPADLIKALEKTDKLISEGKKCCGYISYEAGYLLENRLQKLFKTNGDEIFRFCFYDDPDITELRPVDIEFSGSYYLKPFAIENFGLNCPKEQYVRNIEKIKNYIAEGETYQVNYTVKGLFDFKGDITSLFLALLFNQSAGYAAIINTGPDLIISLSPELFFKTEGKIITAVPMKGTGSRGMNTVDDIAKSELLRESKKDRAENLMIVDLLRNDLGRISKYGSVKAEELFNIEKYESLFQMTSAISAELSEDVSFSGIIKNLFPCGSITGAPKIRTMEIINELEAEPRGIYTGAIGTADKNRSVFNVAIRTIKLDPSAGRGELGLGSGIVWDSDPEKEFEEVLLKSRFLTDTVKPFKIFETTRIENGEIYLMDEHIRRLKNAADYFLFKLDEEKLKEQILKQTSGITWEKKLRLKIELEKYGSINIVTTDFLRIFQ